MTESVFGARRGLKDIVPNRPDATLFTQQISVFLTVGRNDKISVFLTVGRNDKLSPKKTPQQSEGPVWIVKTAVAERSENVVPP